MLLTLWSLLPHTWALHPISLALHTHELAEKVANMAVGGSPVAMFADHKGLDMGFGQERLGATTPPTSLGVDAHTLLFCLSCLGFMFVVFELESGVPNCRWVLITVMTFSKLPNSRVGLISRHC